MKYRNLIILIVGIFTFFGCSDTSDIEPITPGTNTTKQKTVIFYLVGEEFKISAWIKDNLHLICNNLSSKVDSEKINILAYIDLYNQSGTIPETPRLYEIKYSPQLKCGDTLCVKEYKERNSLSVNNLRNFFEMVKQEYPAESYNLIWGSHGSGWFPNPNAMKGRALGPDGTYYMEFDEFTQAIPENMKFDYIIFDACFMSQAEIVMQLRNKVDYILAAPTEIPIKGFPYTEIDLMCNASSPDEYIEICEKFHDMYTKSGTGHTVSLINCSAIENVAQSFKAIIDSCTDEAILRFNIDNVQYYDGAQYCFNYTICCFDLLDMATKLLNTPENQDITNKTELLEQLQNDINGLIEYEAHSKYVNFQNYFEIKNCCGISCYWPSPDVPIANSYYYNYDWCKASGMDYILNYFVEY